MQAKKKRDCNNGTYTCIYTHRYIDIDTTAEKGMVLGKTDRNKKHHKAETELH